MLSGLGRRSAGRAACRGRSWSLPPGHGAAEGEKKSWIGSGKAGSGSAEASFWVTSTGNQGWNIPKWTQSQALGWSRQNKGERQRSSIKNSMENSPSWLFQRILPGCDPRGAGNCCTTPGKEGRESRWDWDRQSWNGILRLRSQIPPLKNPKKKGERRKIPFFQRNPGFYLGWAGAFGGGHEESVLG